MSLQMINHSWTDSMRDRLDDARVYYTSSIRKLATHCCHTGCTKATRERKPFCLDHVLDHDYAHRISEIEELKAKEIEQMRMKHCRTPINGVIALEVLDMCRFGETSAGYVVKTFSPVSFTQFQRFLLKMSHRRKWLMKVDITYRLTKVNVSPEIKAFLDKVSREEPNGVLRWPSDIMDELYKEFTNG